LIVFNLLLLELLLLIFHFHFSFGVLLILLLQDQGVLFDFHLYSRFVLYTSLLFQLFNFNLALLTLFSFLLLHLFVLIADLFGVEKLLFAKYFLALFEFLSLLVKLFSDGSAGHDLFLFLFLRLFVVSKNGVFVQSTPLVDLRLKATDCAEFVLILVLLHDAHMPVLHCE